MDGAQALSALPSTGAYVIICLNANAILNANHPDPGGDVYVSAH